MMPRKFFFRVNSIQKTKVASDFFLLVFVTKFLFSYLICSFAKVCHSEFVEMHRDTSDFYIRRAVHINMNK